MTLPINPYVAGNPVGDSPAFVGRADVLRRAQDNAIVLYGQRRIGKTSILQHLAVRGEDVAELQGQLRVEVEGREKAEAEAIREADIRLWRKWKLERLQAELDAERNAGENLEGDRPSWVTRVALGVLLALVAGAARSVESEARGHSDSPVSAGRGNGGVPRSGRGPERQDVPYSGIDGRFQT